MLKRLLNRSEEMTDARLRAVCEPHGVRVFAKVRLADIFPIEDSGITARAYSFALRSHIDFLVVDEDYDPIFGAEFDGPRHGETIQVQRDVLKADLCRKFQLPLLRIDDRFLVSRYANVDLLTWLASVILQRRADEALVQSGQLSPEDAAAADPIFLAPFVISFEATERLISRHEEGVCDRYAPYFVGVDEKENAHAIAGIRLSDNTWAVVDAKMSNQGFILLAEDLLEEIVHIKLAGALEAVLSKRHAAVTPAEFARRVGGYLRNYRVRQSFLINPRTGEITNLG